MDKLEIRRMEDWTEIINTKTGETIAEGHTIYPEDILTALGYDFFITCREEDE